MLVTTSQVVVVILCFKLEEDPGLPVQSMGREADKGSVALWMRRARFVFLSE